MLDTEPTSFGQRLRAERERLNLTQTQLADLTGIKTNAQGAYEKGPRTPKVSYLLACRAAGLDVVYILTSQRELNHPLLDIFNKLNEHEQAKLLNIAEVFAKENNEVKP
jgi:transcriptional regulator with XRE-family HTH domain